MIGYPICANASVLFKDSTGALRRNIVQTVHSASGSSKYAIISGNSIVLNPSAIEEVPTSPGAADSPSVVSCTSVVSTIIKKVIVPYLSCVGASADAAKVLYKGVLLIGPPGTHSLLPHPPTPSLPSIGTGKTYAIKAVQQLCRAYLTISIKEIRIIDLLVENNPTKKLMEILPLQIPSSTEFTFVIIDEIDALGAPDTHTEVQSYVKYYVCHWMDTLAAANYCVVGTSNRQSAVDPMFCRGGRLELEVQVLNSKDDRVELIRQLLRAPYVSKQLLAEDEIMVLADLLSEMTGGYVASDLQVLIEEACTLQAGSDHIGEVSRYYDNIPVLSSHGKALLACIERAKEKVGPSCLRGVVTKLPKLSLDDVVGYPEVKASLMRVLSFCDPQKKILIKRFNLQQPGGVLLHGPPGNSKTRLIMAAASHFGLPVIALSAADIYSQYVGDAEAEIRKAFRIGRQASPCVLFIDELDAIVTNRADGSGSSSSAESRVLATFLVEMDGINNNSSGCIVMGATNRLGSIDSALLRKGRFHQILHVPLPSAAEKVELLAYFSKKYGFGADTLERLKAQLQPNMSGADVEVLCKEESINIVRQMVQI